MTRHALGNVRHIYQLTAVCLGMTRSARLLLIRYMQFVIEFDRLFRRLISALECVAIAGQSGEK